MACNLLVHRLDVGPACVDLILLPPELIEIARAQLLLLIAVAERFEVLPESLLIAEECVDGRLRILDVGPHARDLLLRVDNLTQLLPDCLRRFSSSKKRQLRARQCRKRDVGLPRHDFWNGQGRDWAAFNATRNRWKLSVVSNASIPFNVRLPMRGCSTIKVFLSVPLLRIS